MAGGIDQSQHDGRGIDGSWSPLDLIGRKTERRLLESMIAGVEMHGAAVVICGEPGVGKSTLLDYAAAAAKAASITVVRVRGVESEAVLPYATMADVLAPLRHLFDLLPRLQRQAIDVCLGL